MRANRYIDRIIAGEFTCCVKRVKPTSGDAVRLGVHWVMMGWQDAAGETVLLTHCFIRGDGRIGASGLLDPKLLKDADGLHYRKADR